MIAHSASTVKRGWDYLIRVFPSGNDSFFSGMPPIQKVDFDIPRNGFIMALSAFCAEKEVIQ
jgi:hypothetical protein